MNRALRRKQQKTAKRDPKQALERAQQALADADWDGAIAAYRQLTRTRPDMTDAWADLGALYFQAGEAAKADTAFRRALELAPQSIPVLSNLANLKKQTGDREAAVDLYRHVLALAPERANAWHELARLKKFQTDDPDIRSIENLYTSKGLDDKGRMHAAFALGKAYEDTGDYDAAFERISAANRLKRADVAFDLDKEKARVDALIRTFDAEFMISRSGLGYDDERPVLVLGMPRSGTTLVEQIVAGHSQAHGAGELDDLGDVISAAMPDFPNGVDSMAGELVGALGRAYADNLGRLAPTARRVIDKMPSNFLLVGILAVILPKARIIHCRRSPLDTCLSCFTLHFPYGQDFSYDLDELGAYYQLYRRLMDHWHRVLPGRILDIDYEDVVADPESRARQLIEFCGLDWQDQCLDFHNSDRLIATASAAQVRQPVYTRSVGRWRRFADHLAPLRAALGAYADDGQEA